MSARAVRDPKTGRLAKVAGNDGRKSRIVYRSNVLPMFRRESA